MSASYFMLRFIRNRRQKRLQTSGGRTSSVREDKRPKTNKDKELKCRICLKEGNIPIFSHESTFDISDAIATFGGVLINEDDEYPNQLCTLCYNFLENAVLFRQSAKETDKLLRESHLQVFYDDLDDRCNPIAYNIPDNEFTTKSYKCKSCKLDFDSVDKLMTHRNAKCYRKVRIQCNICFGLLTPQLYKKHLARHQSISHMVCEICGKLYRKANLVRHVQLHNFNLPFQCQICPYRGRFVESLKLHMRTHTGDKPYSCDKCELRFLTRSNLNRHLLTHKKEKPFKCIECARGFYTKRDMDVHIKGDHIGMKDFLCKMCSNKFATRKSLMRHELRVHKRSKMSTGRIPLYLQAEYQKQGHEVQDDVLSIPNDTNCMEYFEKN